MKLKMIIAALALLAAACSPTTGSPTTSSSVVSTTVLPPSTTHPPVSSSTTSTAGVPTTTTSMIPPSTTSTAAPSTTTTVPTNANVFPGDNVSALVANSPSGTEFIFAPGIYRNFSVRPKDGMSFIGQPGVVLTGAQLLSSFTKTGSVWVTTGITAQGTVRGQCKSYDPTCDIPEDLYVNNVMVQQTKGAVGPGLFKIDYAKNTLTMGDDPTGKTVELAVTPSAFGGNSSNVTIENLTIEKYANTAQSGAIQAKSGNNLASGWVIRNNIVRWNHGVGIKLGTASLVEGNEVYANGQLGIGTGPAGKDNTITSNEVYGNTTLGFLSGYETGGMKLTANESIVVSDNNVYENNGPGIWFDVNVVGALVDSNRVVDNLGPGIFYEISYQAVISNNEVVGNGFGWTSWLYGAGIIVAHSPDVEVVGNLVMDNRLGIMGIQQGRGSGLYGPHEIRNLYVHDNVVVASEGSTGVGQSIGSNAPFSSWGIRFEDNTYYVSGKYFRWLGKTYNFADWNAFGNDTNGSVFPVGDYVPGSG